MKDKTTATIFAFLLGGFGGHKFYLGQTGRGIVYLLFCWTLIPGIIAFIETIMFLTMSQQEFDAKYNNGTASVSSFTANAPAPQKDIFDQLQKLGELHKNGVLTTEEFELQKKQLLP